MVDGLSGSQWEGLLRLQMFLGIFVVIAGFEFLLPYRAAQRRKWKRWLNNLLVVILNTTILRLLFPLTAVSWALLAQEKSWGLFNQTLWPEPLEWILAFVLLDLAIYGQHVLFHYVPWFWRLHRMHHSDVDFDVTTGARFHPLEIVLSLLIKFVVIVAIGASFWAVLIFEIVLNATSMFNHANFSLPDKLDRFLRWFIVTPNMHRIHHSVNPKETNSNFGFNLPWWDRLFATYRKKSEKDDRTMDIGVETFREENQVNLWQMLIQPFR